MIARPRSEAAEHLAYAFFHDAFCCAAPASVKHANRALSHIDQNYGKAIGSLDGDQQAGRAVINRLP